MPRNQLLILALLLNAGCIFGGGNHATVSDAGTSPNSTNSDAGNEPQADGNIDEMIDADVELDGSSNVDPGPDMMPPNNQGCSADHEPVGPSSVCSNEVLSDYGGTIPPRLRTATNGTLFISGLIGEMGTPSIQGALWSNIPIGSPTRPTSGTGVDTAVLAGGQPTGAAAGFVGNVFLWLTTRRATTECAKLKDAFEQIDITCSTDDVALFGAEVVNTDNTPYYFWFDSEGGQLSAMRWDSTEPGGEQLRVPWCVDNSEGCQPVTLGQMDAKATDGKWVMLRDATGRAYLWDVTQLDGERSADTDCECATQPPVPLMIGGDPVDFDTSRVLRTGTSYHLVRQTTEEVEVRPINLDLAIQEPVANTMLRTPGPLFDAAVHSGNFAAVVSNGEGYAVYNFNGAPIGLHNMSGETVLAVSIEVRGNEAVVAAYSRLDGSDEHRMWYRRFPLTN